MTKPNKITFSQLSTPLKTSVVMSYIIGSLYALVFIIGFIMGVMGL